MESLAQRLPAPQLRSFHLAKFRHAEDTAENMGHRRQAGRSFNLPDQRICADRHPEPAHQVLAGTSSEGTSNRGDDLGGSLGLLCVQEAPLFLL